MFNTNEVKVIGSPLASIVKAPKAWLVPPAVTFPADTEFDFSTLKEPVPTSICEASYQGFVSWWNALSSVPEVSVPFAGVM